MNILVKGDKTLSLKTPTRSKMRGVGSNPTHDIQDFVSEVTMKKIEVLRANYTPLSGQIVAEKLGKIVMTSEGGGQEVSLGNKSKT